jgi:hypothetical protein
MKIVEDILSVPREKSSHGYVAIAEAGPELLPLGVW